MSYAYYLKDHKRCEVPDCWRMADHCHHIKSRGAGGTDKESNLIALCAQHHTECHTIGRKRFPAKYGMEKRWERAFTLEGNDGKNPESGTDPKPVDRV